MAGAKKGTPRFRRNYELAPGVMRFSAARMFHKRGTSFYKKTKTAKKYPAQPANFIVKKIKGAKNGGERKVLIKKGPALLGEDKAYEKPAPIARKAKVTALRKSITPGTVLIVLAGRHKGKRVVFLKQMEKSGLLLVTGPHQWNNTPVRRIAQSFVIATSTKIDISGVKVPDHLNDEYFRRKHAKAAKGEQANIFAAGKEEYKVTEQRKADQKLLDKAVIAAIKKNKEAKALRGYLSTRFHLSRSILPHKVLF
uniref:Large ribosomal subunit protein eL6 n=1 Tax=Sudhausia crassa TaxID=1357960 RepID=S5M210_9BILA|nr:large subunit ribosomal protein 6 [Sudhausia crassa]